MHKCIRKRMRFFGNHYEKENTHTGNIFTVTYMYNFAYKMNFVISYDIIAVYKYLITHKMYKNDETIAIDLIK